MIEPARAHVRPRVIVPETGDTLPLEELVCDLRGEIGQGLAIIGGAGAGKSTALAHVAACVDRSARIVFLDGPTRLRIDAALGDGAVVVALREEIMNCPCPSYRLAPWSKDDLVEYLLSRHPQMCASVMRRIAAASDRTLHQGRPELCRAVLDRMAEFENLDSVSDALRQEMHDALTTPENRRIAEQYALATLARDETQAGKLFKRLRARIDDDRPFRLLRHEPLQLVLASDGLAAMLARNECGRLERQLPRRLVEMTGTRLGDIALGHLHNELIGGSQLRHAMVASLLHAAGQNSALDIGSGCNLAGAYLAKSNWAALRLEGLVLPNCDVSESDLAGVVLNEANARGTNFARCVLRGASLIRVKARSADFQQADLSSANAEFADLEDADFTGADLSGACFHGAVLRGAQMRDTRLDRADLRMATLREARIEGASFAGADLVRADLTALALRTANLSGAKFVHARLNECDLEEVELPAANFARANLDGANLTSTRMRGANFSHASLIGAKLADVDWEAADLTSADLTGCVFHFGSSRSGLVGSPLASEGSRTGFYGDDFDQQFFCSPEEIRKANLCGVDLTGANLANTDFYLVDLRRAKYTEAQFEHLRRCGAILFERE